MRYINTLHEGETIRNVYLCKGKRSAETRNGRPYDNLILQDKTGTLDGKVWDPNSQGIADYDEKDFIEVFGDIINYNGNLQMNIRQIRVAQEGDIIRLIICRQQRKVWTVCTRNWWHISVRFPIHI